MCAGAAVNADWSRCFFATAINCHRYLLSWFLCGRYILQWQQVFCNRYLILPNIKSNHCLSLEQLPFVVCAKTPVDSKQQNIDIDTDKIPQKLVEQQIQKIPVAIDSCCKKSPDADCTNAMCCAHRLVGVLSSFQYSPLTSRNVNVGHTYNNMTHMISIWSQKKDTSNSGVLVPAPPTCRLLPIFA